MFFRLPFFSCCFVQEKKMNLESDVGAYEKKRLQDLSSRRNTTVLTVEHDFINEPWPVSRLRPLLERLAKRVTEFPDGTDEFVVRKTCLDDPEVLQFQRMHPQLYYMVTDRKLVKEEKFRNAVNGLLHVRGKVENGEVTNGQEADGMATQTVLSALHN